jgi:hypothetical protein
MFSWSEHHWRERVLVDHQYTVVMDPGALANEQSAPVVVMLASLSGPREMHQVELGETRLLNSMRSGIRGRTSSTAASTSWQ